MSQYPVAIETPTRAKLDVSAFRRILVAGFLTGGDTDIDPNIETVRLLRSQLRSKAPYQVIDAETLPLWDLALGQAANVDARTPDRTVDQAERPERVRNAKDLADFEHLFANAGFWKQLGREYQEPLIVTGTLVFRPELRVGPEPEGTENVDTVARRTGMRAAPPQIREGYILEWKVIFLDGQTGAMLHSETVREEVFYGPAQNVPALAAYFELMDRVVPGFLGAISSQTVRGLRVLIK